MDDLISRQAVLKIIDGWYENNRDIENIEDLIILITYMASIKPQAQEPCSDAISRVAAIDKLDEWDWQEFYLPIHFKELLDELPPVSTEKTGRWEWNQYDYNPNLGNWHCSECGSIAMECVHKKNPSGVSLYKYCPNCGSYNGGD